MAQNFLLLASTLVLFSSLAIVSADGYGYDAPVNSPKSTYAPSSTFENPAPEYTPDAVYSSPPSPIYKSTAHTEGPEYKKPVHTPTPSYHATPVSTPKPAYTSYSAEKEMPTIYGVQGIIYCRYGYDVTPLKGATAKIACMAKGYKPTSFTLVTPETDDNGYFLATFSPKELSDHLKPKNCKVYLNSSPTKSCNIATDVGKGISGAPLTYSRTIHDYMNMYNMELYSVSPFVYKSAKYRTPASTYRPKTTYDAPTYTPKAEYKKAAYIPAPETSTYGQSGY